jgi:hypothetical protein
MPKHPTPDELGQPDLQIAGFQLWVHNCDDEFWLNLTAHTGALGASVWASGSILKLSDLAGLASQCEALGKGESDEAWLGAIEPELKVTIKRTDQLGHFSMHVEITPDYLNQQHSFEFEIDQTYLSEIVRQCRRVVTSYYP